MRGRSASWREGEEERERRWRWSSSGLEEKRLLPAAEEREEEEKKRRRSAAESVVGDAKKRGPSFSFLSLYCFPLAPTAFCLLED